MSVKISASDVNKLRQQTGAGMMDCKKALVEANGDFDAAIDYLRKKGAKVAASRQDRESNEGVIIAKTTSDNKSGVIIEVNCETDFVAKNADFIAFAEAIAEKALNEKPADLDALKALEIDGVTIENQIIEQTGKIGEKIELSTYQTVSAERVIPYIHGNYRLGVLVGLSADSENIEEVGKDVAMQIAAMNPIAIDKNGVDASIVERELEIAKEQIRAEGKPEELLEKIAQGKLNRFYKDNTLLQQDFVKDSSKSVAKVLDEVSKGLTVTEFKRVQLGA
ncbi:MAG TPA: translation elongation factor Ts [Candidatus Sphingobacterium stercoripullorum]|uniref:Elongation factor Ts n=1 Tax=Candidatus Sphingobacterium stercoripullorum TaxID=2838759 RepID=A0A9D1WAC6_9SPHI|nr:translation elongation factor Ts [Candidatus Sphingobacterium stercoripullorum]HLR49510.1 translation elongation factor Ts [Candidatus Sphingobacterium stercoripullorum]